MQRADLPIEKVEIPEERVTSYFDQDAYEEFKRTVAKVGVIEPIVCIEVDSRYILVDGLHRLEEAKVRGDKTIVAVVIPGAEEDIFLTNLFLNVMRGKTKIAEVRRTIEILADDFHMNADKISKRTGLSKQYVVDLVRIGDLPDVIIQAFDAGLLSKGAALALCKLSPPELQLRVFAEISGRDLSVEDIEGIVDLLREEAHEIEPPAPRESHPVDREFKCDACHEVVEYHLVRGTVLCPDCQRAFNEFLAQQKTTKETPA